jgi:hypothetical protein
LLPCIRRAHIDLVAEEGVTFTPQLALFLCEPTLQQCGKPVGEFMAQLAQIVAPGNFLPQQDSTIDVLNLKNFKEIFA